MKARCQSVSGMSLPTKAMSAVARTIRTLRLSKQMSQAELGDVVGVTRAAVHQWEKGKSVPQIHHLQELARFFGVPLATMLGDEGTVQSVDAALRVLPRDVADALKASFLATIETIKTSGK
jgi:transcriptional regulator with XRE-family HTH domain